MTSSVVFKTKRGQTVRLPRSVAFPEDVLSVDILKIGHSRVLVPQGRRWDELFENGPRLSEDYIFPETRPDEVYGSLPAKGKPKTIKEMDAGVLAEAARRHKRGR